MRLRKQLMILMKVIAALLLLGLVILSPAENLEVQAIVNIINSLSP